MRLRRPAFALPARVQRPSFFFQPIGTCVNPEEYPPFPCQSETRGKENGLGGEHFSTARPSPFSFPFDIYVVI